jgi:hypothetical protein
VVRSARVPSACRDPPGRVATESRLCRRFPVFDVVSRQGPVVPRQLDPRTRGWTMPTIASLGQTPPANVCNHLSTHEHSHELANLARSRGIGCPSHVASPPSVDNGAAQIARRRSDRSVTSRQAGRVARSPCRPLIAGRTLTGQAPSETSMGASPEARSPPPRHLMSPAPEASRLDARSPSAASQELRHASAPRRAFSCLPTRGAFHSLKTAPPKQKQPS